MHLVQSIGTGIVLGALGLMIIAGIVIPTVLDQFYRAAPAP